MKKFIEKFHFITHDLEQLTHVQQAQIACQSGAKWIQYRCLTKTDEELLIDINNIAEICDDWGATLVVTNHIHLNGKADIQGFHIENMEADFIQLREHVGESITLGGSANTVEGVARLASEGADYVGLGPFAHTDTKPNNYPHLGTEGYKTAVNELYSLGIQVPILAVGGISLADIDALLATGVFGIAASSAINQADDMAEAYQAFYNKIR
jgi:thiamine-phosphate pyrophosphorylase